MDKFEYYNNMTQVKVSIEVFDHYKGRIYKDDSRSFYISQVCPSNVVNKATGLQYDEIINQMKLRALAEATKYVNSKEG